MQVTDTPRRITIAVNKANYTHDMIVNTGEFVVSTLASTAQMELFKHFGYQSGRDVDKFEGIAVERAANGLIYLPWSTNSYMAAHVLETIDQGTHTLFIAEVTEAKTISAEPSLTYDDYFKYVKPAPLPTQEKQTGWVCKICGYVHEGEDLPPDIVCPLCKHGAEAFEKIV
jgi:flavin reductase (DIM6/NTAB) family NADH-FMN oxidoreductase RutF/rubredoxin